MNLLPNAFSAVYLYTCIHVSLFLEITVPVQGPAVINRNNRSCHGAILLSVVYRSVVMPIKGNGTLCIFLTAYINMFLNNILK